MKQEDLGLFEGTVTFEQAFNRLPDDIKKRAIDKFYAHRKAKIALSANHQGVPISGAFSWSESKEGHDYWEAVFHKYQFGSSNEIPDVNEKSNITSSVEVKMSEVSSSEIIDAARKKAIELVSYFYRDGEVSMRSAKNFALFCCDEVIKEIGKNWLSAKRVFLEKQWEGVKQEIEKIENV